MLLGLGLVAVVRAMRSREIKRVFLVLLSLRPDLALRDVAPAVARREVSPG